MSIIHELQNYTFTSKYANHLSEEKRREDWKESVGRVEAMMLRKYAGYGVDDDIRFAYGMMRKKKSLGSQRALQFGGKAAEKRNTRLFNCTGSFCDRLRFFQEAFWLLLCGCGVGYSVQTHHVAKLPPLYTGKRKGTKTFTIPDTIEGWADAVGVLLSSYFQEAVDDEHEKYIGYSIKFKYDKIRPEGSKLSSGGKAPGPAPLRKSLEAIRELLKRCVKGGQTGLRTIDAHDIVCHVADAVLSGGIRRSACIALFSLDDELMMRCKSGDWYEENPQRQRANNSVVLVRNRLKFEDFDRIVQLIRKNRGEPGFVITDSTEIAINPCQPGWAQLLTPDGIRPMSEINVGDEIWSETGWTKVLNKWSTGVNKVFKYTTNGGVFYGTEGHRLVSNGQKIEAKDAPSIDTLTCEDRLYAVQNNNLQAIMDGLVIGDGSVHAASNNLVYLCIGKDDVMSYMADAVRPLIERHRPGIKKYAWEVTTTIKHSELPKTHLRTVPERYIQGSFGDKCSFLRGLYSANGSVVRNRITLKAASRPLIEQVQMMLSSIGIRSYVTTNKTNKVEFANGTYQCRESYDLNITADRDKFALHIGFIQKYKDEKINLDTVSKGKKVTYDIVDVELVSEEETFDITVDNNTHTYWTQGVNVSNCGEVMFWPVCMVTKLTGWGFCNLSTINCKLVKTVEDFYECCRSAAIKGTLQAGFTDFHYLGETSQNIAKQEALIGVSLTGVMDSYEIVLDPEVQRKGAKIVREENERIAKLLGINPAARTTLGKPEGTSSLMLGCSVSMNAHHANRFLRGVIANPLETTYQYFKLHNPLACERSLTSANGKDEMIRFPIEVPDGSKTRNQLPAIEMLKIIQSTKKNWVDPGQNRDTCAQPWLSHNISNTITVKDDEWEEVTQFIYDNKDDFIGVTLLNYSGDRDYKQAPYVEVLTSRQIIREYGDPGVWCSGLIELGLEAFDDDLWDACTAMEDDEFPTSLKENVGDDSAALFKASRQARFYEKARKFATKYFDGDLRRLSYCLKDVYNWKRYCDIKEAFVPVDYKKMVEEENGTNFEGEMVCSGGSCEL